MFAVPFILPDKKRTSKKARPPAELKVFVERVTFHNPENGFSVLRVSDKKHWGTDTVVGFASPVSAGLYIHATGRWQSCEDGHQLRAEVIRTKLPTETDDIQKCLGSGLVEGIGPAYAERFMETFGGKIFDILDKHPEKLLKVEGEGQKRCDLIARSWTEQKAVRNAVNFLIDHEVSSELAVKIVRTYGIDTVRIVKEDPYRLARDLRRIDFHWADAFAKRIGIGLHSAVRARAGLAYVLNELSAGMGNTFLPRAELEAMTCELLGVPKRVVAKAIDEALERGDVAVSDVPKPGSIYPAELLRAEEGVATEIARLTSGSLPWGALDLDGGTASTRGALCRRRLVDDPRRGRSGCARSCSLRTYFGLSLGAGALRGFAQLRKPRESAALKDRDVQKNPDYADCRQCRPGHKTRCPRSSDTSLAMCLQTMPPDIVVAEVDRILAGRADASLPVSARTPDLSTKPD